MSGTPPKSAEDLINAVSADWLLIRIEVALGDVSPPAMMGGRHRSANFL
jgi:hypothetical protein